MSVAGPRHNKIRIILLVVAVIYSLFTVSLFYSEFLLSPQTVDDAKYAVAFLYEPLLVAVLAASALLLMRIRDSIKLSQLCVQLGLFLSAGVLAWWLVFERGLLPTTMMPFIFLSIVMNDMKESRRLNR